MKKIPKARFIFQYLLLVKTSVIAQVFIQPALAHANHDHSKNAEEPSQKVVDQNTATEATNSDVIEASPEPNAETLVDPMSHQARLFDGFSIDIGESLFVLILVGPFLLLSLKRKRD
ncbi:MAG: hypothetical protein ACFB2W_22765 [Leptolyngbyaceae cyanobacterium]